MNKGFKGVVVLLSHRGASPGPAERLVAVRGCSGGFVAVPSPRVVTSPRGMVPQPVQVAARRSQSKSNFIERELVI